MSKILLFPPRSTTRLVVSMPFQGHWAPPLVVATHTKKERWMYMTDLSSGRSLKGVAPSKLREKPTYLRWWLEWQVPVEEPND